MWQKAMNLGGGGGEITETKGTVSGQSTSITCKKSDIVVAVFTRSTSAQIYWNNVLAYESPDNLDNASIGTAIVEVFKTSQENNALHTQSGQSLTCNYYVISQ